MATGSEVSTALEIAKELEKEGKDIRVVSMPSVELFLENSKEYQNDILIPGVKTFVMEASTGQELRRFTSNDKYLMTLNTFGTSAPYEDVLDYMDYSQEKRKQKIKEML